MKNQPSEYDISTRQEVFPPATGTDHSADTAECSSAADGECGMRRRFTGTFKAAVVLEALEGKQSVQELAERHQLHPNQIRNWKSLFRKRLPYLFEDRRLCNPGRRNPFLMNEDTIPGEG